MATPENDANRAVVLYQGAPLEQIGTRALIFPGGRQQESRFFLPEDIVVGRYGVIGFLVIDKTPEQRWVSYTSYDWTGVEVRDYDASWRGGNATHFLNTDQGFKMVRYFILPPSVGDFFAKDKFLGEPLIDKCCREGTLPEEFDEEKAYPNIAFWSGDEVQEGLIRPVIKASLPELSGDELFSYDWGKNQNSYVSFHPWQDFKYVIGEGQNSIHAAISNFDDVIGKFDTKQLLTPRDLRVTSGDNSQIQIAGQ